MKRIILISIILIFLTGCGGLYNISNFVLPDDLEFLALVKELDTPEKICQYMLDNFEYELHLAIMFDPYMLWMKQKGDCDDMANFAMFISNCHGYETFLVKIKYKNYAINHYLAIYKENGLYNFSSNQYYSFVNYNNFLDIVKFDSQWMYDFYGYIWTKYIVYDYWNNIVEEVYSD